MSWTLWFHLQKDNVKSHIDLVKGFLFSFIDKNATIKEGFDTIVEKYARLCHRDFLGFYPYSMYKDLVSLIVRRALEYLDRNVPADG